MPLLKSEDNSKLRKTDIAFVLQPIDGKKPLSSTGQLDPRLFKGGNRLRAVMDPSNTLWSFKMDAGGLTEPLKQRFKTFKDIHNYAKAYLAKRNLQIIEVVD